MTKVVIISRLSGWKGRASINYADFHSDIDVFFALNRGLTYLEIANFYEMKFKESKGDFVIHSMNPSFLNGFSQLSAVEYFHFVDEKGELRRFFDDNKRKIKFEYLGPGEICGEDEFLNY